MSAASAVARPRLDPASFPSMGPGQLRPGRDNDAIDGLVPQAVITARETAHVVATIEEARAKKLAVVPSGGGTLLHVGAVPRAYDIRLSMTAIGNIVEENPEDMTVTCQAGVSLSRLQRSLAKQGQRLAIDAAREDRASIGGIVAANATGGLRHGFGLPRDLVLGATAIDGCGREIVAGGRVVKNVAGYDLVRLFAGSWGGLAILTELTLRTHPLPAAAATLVFEFVSASELDAARSRLAGAQLSLSAIDFTVDTTEAMPLWILVVRIEGTEEEVGWQGDAVCALVGRQPADAAEEWESPAHVDDGHGTSVRVAAAPQDIVGVVRDVCAKWKQSAASQGGQAAIRIAGHLGAGIARFHLAGAEAGEADTASAALITATAVGGLVRGRVIERAPAQLKALYDVWGPPPASIGLMRAIKRRFDPDDVLSPGRYVGGL